MADPLASAKNSALERVLATRAADTMAVQRYDIRGPDGTFQTKPTDLAQLTAGLAGSFQSLVESAGMSLHVDCSQVREPVFIDRSMWEKVVANLVSNAFKFTLEGAISVRLPEHDEHVELVVSDTGTGIPKHELPRIFDRFHRVEGTRGRSF